MRGRKKLRNRLAPPTPMRIASSVGWEALDRLRSQQAAFRATGYLHILRLTGARRSRSPGAAYQTAGGAPRRMRHPACHMGRTGCSRGQRRAPTFFRRSPRRRTGRFARREARRPSADLLDFALPRGRVHQPPHRSSGIRTNRVVAGDSLGSSGWNPDVGSPARRGAPRSFTRRRGDLSRVLYSPFHHAAGRDAGLCRPDPHGRRSAIFLWPRRHAATDPMTPRLNYPRGSPPRTCAAYRPHLYCRTRHEARAAQYARWLLSRHRAGDPRHGRGGRPDFDRGTGRRHRRGARPGRGVRAP